MQQLSGRTAVVIGGGSGIGRGIALALADEGTNLVIADIARDTAQQRSIELRGHQRAIAHQEHVLSAAFAQTTVGRQHQPFRITVGDGLHLDELGVVVVPSGLGLNREGVGRRPVPR